MKYGVELTDGGVLVLRGLGTELKYIELEALDGVRPIAHDDLSESWRFPGTDVVELVATEAGPVFRSWSCRVPIGVTPTAISTSSANRTAPVAQATPQSAPTSVRSTRCSSMPPAASARDDPRGHRFAVAFSAA